MHARSSLFCHITTLSLSSTHPRSQQPFIVSSTQDENGNLSVPPSGSDTDASNDPLPPSTKAPIPSIPDSDSYDAVGPTSSYGGGTVQQADLSGSTTSTPLHAKHHHSYGGSSSCSTLSVAATLMLSIPFGVLLYHASVCAFERLADRYLAALLGFSD